MMSSTVMAEQVSKLDDMIGQMSQIDVTLLLDTDEDGKSTANQAKLEYYFGVLGVGSLLNTPLSEPWTAADYRAVVVAIQNITETYNRPPVIWGLDSVHGANYIHGAVMTPQPINLAATFNSTTSYTAGIIASRDTRAAGITWLFSPLLGLSLEPKWSRVYETFGEDPFLVGDMAAAMISGIQHPDTSGIPSRAAACAKHFVGYSMPKNGHDRSPSWIPTRHLYQYFVPPWRTGLAKENGGAAMTVMESYSETDGVPNVANSKTTKTLLRQQLDFDGVLVTDYQEIMNLQDWHGIVASHADATVHALSEGSVDMSMIPFDAEGFRSAIQNGVANGDLSVARIQNSAARVVRLKEQLGMTEEKVLIEHDILHHVGQGREEALAMAHQGIVLVENRNNALPLNVKEKMKIHVTGPTSHSLSSQSGGWSGQWQGVPSDDVEKWFTYGSTVVEAVANTSANWDVTISCGVDILGNECADDANEHGGDDISGGVLSTVKGWIGMDDDDDATSIERAVKQASHSEVTIVCVGEEAYTEKPGDVRSLKLPDGQIKLVQALKGKTKKLVVVFFGGRPRLLEEMSAVADAVFVNFLPGPDAGRALADLVAGLQNPSGKLPLTYPKYEDGGGAPYFHAVSDQCTAGEGMMPHYAYVPCEIQWPFGHGLSYTTFEHTDLTLSSTKLQYSAIGQKRPLTHIDKLLTVSVKVKNTGSRAGSEAVLFFTFDESRHVTPEMKRLRFFEKIFLQPGEEKLVTATISAEDPNLQAVGAHDDTHPILQNGMRFRVGIGAHSDCRGEPSEQDLCSDYVTIDAGHDYVGACDVACRLWGESRCDYQFESPTKCWEMCTSASVGGEQKNDGWGWNYVNCIEPLISEIKQEGRSGQDQCWKMTALCRNIFATDLVQNFGSTVPTANFTAATAVALFAASIGIALILKAFRRTVSIVPFSDRRNYTADDDDGEFTLVDRLT